jgi:RNA 3'-terminal phosphate cyclase (ATP)
MLIFQAVFPYLLFAGNEAGEPVELEIRGGTNVSFSLSWEYLDQVLLPTLQDRFGIYVKRGLRTRGWSAGTMGKGCVWFKIQPVALGQTLKHKEAWDKPLVAADFNIKHIDVSILAPFPMHESLQEALVKDLDVLFPDVDVNFVLVENSGHEARMYTLLVAHGSTGLLRWGRDFLYDRSSKNKKPEALSAEISQKVSKDLFEEIAVRGVVDEFLQDQLVVFQSLAEGKTSFPRGAEPVGTGDGGSGNGNKGVDELAMDMDKLDIGKRMRKDKTHGPFGEGSTHTTTARWVTAELLTDVKWFNKGSVCDGVGVSFS